MMNQNPTQQLAGARYRGLLIIWGAQVCSLALLFGLTQFIPAGGAAGGGRTLLLVLGAVGLVSFALSFVVRPRLIAQAARQRRPDLVTTGYILAFALCEACAIFGLVAHFVTGAREALYFFAPPALGLALHFPRRRHFEEGAGGGETGGGFKSTL